MKKIKTSKKEKFDCELVFKALSSGLRRQILVCLSQKAGPMQAGEIVEQLSCVWSTATEHLQALEMAGLVTVHKDVHDGRVQIYEIAPERLLVVQKWLDDVRGSS